MSCAEAEETLPGGFSGASSVAGSSGSDPGGGGDGAGGEMTGSGGNAGGGPPITGGAGGIGSGGVGGGIGGAGPTTGCDGTTLLPVPADPGVRGPWHVGVRTVTIGRLTAEVVYPAEPGTTAGLPETTYDIRDWLPVSERTKVPDSAVPAVGPIGGHLYRDVPIDAEHGPYPVIIMIHGTSSFRIASGSINVHWASRGFVVVAADYPGLGLHDKLAEVPGCSNDVTGVQDVPGDVNAQMAALKSASGDLAFLSGNIDMTRVGLSGHSQGACISAQLATLPEVQIVVPLTGSTTVATGPSLKSIMFIAGMDDTVIGYTNALGIGNLVCSFGTSNVAAYEASPGPPDVTKRIVGITGGGHLVPTDLCQTNDAGNNAIEEAKARMVCGIDNAVFIGLPAIFDCGTISMERGIYAVNYASTAALEETLLCKDTASFIDDIQANVPEVGDYQHAP